MTLATRPVRISTTYAPICSAMTGLLPDGRGRRAVSLSNGPARRRRAGRDRGPAGRESLRAGPALFRPARRAAPTSPWPFFSDVFLHQRMPF
ncbi:hypothetical protein GCM10010305_08370 [Streptomyces termitum]|uniref:Uncharacterized protein n=1 Tax=Streptomyces termitum TaxID=67368 RepID=A0A918W5Z0_9ACTN|nr:hypothetical protein GCM10010305_08370 [Streptomyces termitum]